MSRFGLVVRSALLWILSALHFFPVGAFLVLLGAFVDPRKNDWPQRVFFRNVLRCAGVRFRVVRHPGFHPDTTGFFICNHVNIFDPFIIYSAIPQFVRGLELESHFEVPVYGWMMKRFGNVPVPVRLTRDAILVLEERCRHALEDGISLVVFPEGTRSRTGSVGPFKNGVFRMATKFGTPVTPISIVGAFEFKRAESWLLRPATIVVHLHETIHVRADEDADVLKERVRGIVAGPVEAKPDA